MMVLGNFLFKIFYLSSNVSIHLSQMLLNLILINSILAIILISQFESEVWNKFYVKT